LGRRSRYEPVVNFFLRCLALVVVFGSVVFGSAAAAADDASRPRVLVLDPSSQVFDPATISTITSLLIVELSKEHRLDVISAGEVRKLAELEGEKQAIGCVDTSCLAELAGAMGARYVVFGDVGSLGSTVVLTLNLFDSQTTQALNRITVQSSNGITGLPAAVEGRLAPLVAPLLKPATPPTTTTTTPTPTPAPEAPPPPPATTTSSGPGLLPWLMIGGGTLFTVGGAAVDVLSPTSRNGEFDAIDVVGPVAYLAGPALAVVGVVFLFSDDAEEVSP